MFEIWLEPMWLDIHLHIWPELDNVMAAPSWMLMMCMKLCINCSVLMSVICAVVAHCNAQYMLV